MSEPKVSNRAIEIASQIWCKPETANKEMDSTLAMAFAQVIDELQSRIDKLEKERKICIDNIQAGLIGRLEIVAELKGRLILDYNECDMLLHMLGERGE